MGGGAFTLRWEHGPFGSACRLLQSNRCLDISLPLPFPGVVLEKNVVDHSLFLYRAKAESQPPRSY